MGRSGARALAVWGFALLCLSLLGGAFNPAAAKTTQPYECGVTSSKFARICRPQANASCLSAVARGVKGYSKSFCAVRKNACTSCLMALRTCIGKIGHGPRSQYSCDECTGKFSRCIGKRYPALPAR